MIAVAVFILFAQATGSIGESIGGTVTDSVTHKPVHPAQVRGVNGPGDLSDAEGHYSLNGVPAGELMLRIESNGYRRLDIGSSLAQGDSLKLDFELRPLARLSGKVVDKDSGEPITRRVRLEQKDGVGGGYAPPDKKGAFEFADLEPGDYSLTTVGIDDVSVRFEKADPKNPGPACGFISSHHTADFSNPFAMCFEIPAPCVVRDGTARTLFDAANDG
jgi:Carboxypeptidase regulatory-like domain